MSPYFCKEGQPRRFPMQYIAASPSYSTYTTHIPAPYFRKSFSLPEKPQSAFLVITGLGFYELHLNGQEITKGKLAPYISNPDHLVYFDRYQIADCLTAGKNVLAIQLGNGLQNNPGGEVWDFDRAKWRGAPRLALRLELTFADGTTMEIESDESFRTADSPLIFDDFRLGVHYDANRELPGWDTPAFDDSGWKNAIPVEAPRGEEVFCVIDPIVAAREFTPVRVEKMTIPSENIYRAKGKFAPEQLPGATIDGYLYDFGTNQTGICRLKLHGTPGQKISIWFGDGLKNGQYLHNNVFVRETCLDTIYQTLEYTCKGGEEIFEPNFTYYGYQYAFVSGITEEQATPELLTYVELHSKLEERGNFTCSHPVLNKLQEMTRRSTLSNLLYFPTDCPHREKNGWTADASLSAEHALLNLDPEQYYKEWLHNIRKAQDDRGALPGIVPTGGWGFAWGNGPAWDNVLINLPYFTYLYRGDRTILEENADAILRYVNYLTTRLDENGLMAIGLGDWCSPVKDGPLSPQIFTDSVCTLDIFRKAAFIMGELGRKPQQAFCETLAETLLKNIRRDLIDFASMTALGNCQTSQAMAIYYDLFTPAEKPVAFAALLEMLADDNYHLTTGVLGARVIFHVLSDFGYTDLALEILCQPEAPSYGYWVAQGYSTLLEDMFPIHAERIPSSLNHHFWGDVSHWFLSALAGICINPHGRSVHEVHIRPHFAETLEYAEGFHITPDGKVSSSWKRDGDRILLTLEIPVGTFGRILLEPGYRFADQHSQKDLQSGTYEIFAAFRPEAGQS